MSVGAGFRNLASPDCFATAVSTLRVSSDLITAHHSAMHDKGPDVSPYRGFCNPTTNCTQKNPENTPIAVRTHRSRASDGDR